MRRALTAETGTELARLAGIAAAAAGALLLGRTDPFAADVLAPLGMHVDWLLSAGPVCTLGGGVLRQ